MTSILVRNERPASMNDPHSSERVWYVRSGDVVLEFPETELKRTLRTGSLSPDTLLSKDEKTWRTIRDYVKGYVYRPEPGRDAPSAPVGTEPEPETRVDFPVLVTGGERLLETEPRTGASPILDRYLRRHGGDPSRRDLKGVAVGVVVASCLMGLIGMMMVRASPIVLLFAVPLLCLVFYLALAVSAVFLRAACAAHNLVMPERRRIREPSLATAMMVVFLSWMVNQGVGLMLVPFGPVAILVGIPLGGVVLVVTIAMKLNVKPTSAILISFAYYVLLVGVAAAIVALFVLLTGWGR